MKHKIRAAVGAMIAVIGMSIAAAAPALAKPLEHDHFVESGSEIIQEVDPLFCEEIVDFPVLHEWTVQENFLLVVRGDGFAYSAIRLHATDVWTNTLNGKALTVITAGQERDQKIIDNGNGTLTINAAFTGVQKVYGPDGGRLFMDTGITKVDLLFDNSGTPTNPFDDEFISFKVTSDTGLSDLAEREFCQDLVTFIG